MLCWCFTSIAFTVRDVVVSCSPSPGPDPGPGPGTGPSPWPCPVIACVRPHPLGIGSCKVKFIIRRVLKLMVRSDIYRIYID